MPPDRQPDVVYLSQFPRSRLLPSMSSFCLKVETWLRMADVPYENESNHFTGRSAKGLSPYVTVNGTQIADSHFIVEELTEMFNKQQQMGPANDEEFAKSVALDRMIEHSLHWLDDKRTGVCHRIKDFKRLHFTPWSDAMSSAQQKAVPLISWLMTRKMRTKLDGHGYGGHSDDEIYKIATAELRALSIYLGDQQYFLGDRPTTLDATAFGHLAQLQWTVDEFPVQQYMRAQCPNLVGYLERIKQKYWPDWHAITTELTMDSDWKGEKR